MCWVYPRVAPIFLCAEITLVSDSLHVDVFVCEALGVKLVNHSPSHVISLQNIWNDNLKKRTVRKHSAICWPYLELQAGINAEIWEDGDRRKRALFRSGCQGEDGDACASVHVCACGRALLHCWRPPLPSASAVQGLPKPTSDVPREVSPLPTHAQSRREEVAVPDDWGLQRRVVGSLHNIRDVDCNTTEV